ncbi:MAG: hypothetical protein FJX19_01230 [Alphaproteobacteria bacterium]|nr:hypothetical protein [Alphaproteobacteria bacterium]
MASKVASKDAASAVASGADTGADTGDDTGPVGATAACGPFRARGATGPAAAAGVPWARSFAGGSRWGSCGASGARVAPPAGAAADLGAPEGESEPPVARLLMPCAAPSAPTPRPELPDTGRGGPRGGAGCAPSCGPGRESVSGAPAACWASGAGAVPRGPVAPDRAGFLDRRLCRQRHLQRRRRQRGRLGRWRHIRDVAQPNLRHGRDHLPGRRHRMGR